MKEKLINTLDIENYDIDKIQEKIMDIARKKYGEQILTTTSTIKQEVLNFEDIENDIKLLEKNKSKIILLNNDIRWWFEKILWYENSWLDRFWLCSLMWINIINYPYEKFNFYFHWALEKYDEVILIPKETEIYIIDSKEFLELKFNIIWNKNY